MMKKILFEDALILSFAKAARAFVHVLPLGFSLWMARGVGFFAYHFTKRKRIAHKNLRAAFARELSRRQMKRIARQSIQNIVMSMVELLRFPDLTQGTIRAHVTIQGLEKFRPSLEQRKGIIFLTAHFGNWELLNVTGGLIGYPMVAITRAQKHPRSDEFLNSLRVSTGCQVIRKGIPLREILKALQKGKIVGILSDQDGGRRGRFVRFFGRLSSTPSGVASFSLRTGAAIFPVFNFRECNWVNHRVEVEGPLQMPDTSLEPKEAERLILQQFADILETKIRKSPHQWLWGHRRWKSTPDRYVLVLSDGKAGHLNQSLAVVQGIQEEMAAQGIPPLHAHVNVVPVHFKNSLMKSAFKALYLLLRGTLPFKYFLLKIFLRQDSFDPLMKTYADIVISCGSSLDGVNLCLKHENDAKSIVVMKPLVPLRHFDAVIAPWHDRLKAASNVFETQGALSQVDEETLAKEASRLLDELHSLNGHRRIGFLVGGDTDQVHFHKDSFEKALDAIRRYSLEFDAVLLATSSRRTPAWADECLKRYFRSHERCPLLVIANEANRAGVVHGILGLSDVVVVSGESVSMISEALSSGKRLVVFMPTEEPRLKPKHQHFLAKLYEEKRALQATSQNLYEILKNIDELLPAPAVLGASKNAAVLRAVAKHVI